MSKKAMLCTCHQQNEFASGNQSSPNHRLFGLQSGLEFRIATIPVSALIDRNPSDNIKDIVR